MTATNRPSVLLYARQLTALLTANPLITFSAIILLYALSVRYFTPLRKIPGPFLGSLTRLWKVKSILYSRQELVYIDLHKKYGIYFFSGPDLGTCHINFQCKANLCVLVRMKSVSQTQKR